MSDYLQSEISESSKKLKLALRLAVAGDNVFGTHHALEALALNYTGLGELDTALAYESQMLPDRELYYQSVNQTLRDLGTLADLTLNLKLYSTSISISKEAVAITLKESPDSSRIILSLQDVVEAASAKQEFDTALKYANDAMQIVVTLDDSAENTRTKAQSYVMLADLNSQINDCTEALTNYDKALELYGRLPEMTYGLYDAHKGKLFCFQKLNRREDFSNELTTVLRLSEKYRATIREDDSRQAFFASEQVVFDAATTNAINGHDSRGGYAFVEASKARSLLDFVESKKSIVEVEKTFGPVAQPLRLEDIQARLPEQVQIVQYAVLPDRLAIWIVSKTRFDFIEKPVTAIDLEDKIAAYQALIIGKGSLADIKSAGQELYALLIPQDLAREKQICFIPDKALHQLAFASLVSPARKYLLEDYALFYSPSASVLVLATEDARRKEQVTNESLLSIGNPDFDREENPNLSDLPDAETEAKVIAGTYPKSQQFIRGDATGENFLLIFAKVEVIHFAGHFVANPQSPGNSKLLFAGGELRSNKLSSYKLPKSKLVVLSACQTGFERYNKSEGTIGIARTLLALGAPVIVASQWKVDSTATKDLMIAFHQNRKQKRTATAESLRRAQLEILSRAETKSPFYWAAFSMFGGYSNY